MLRGTGKIVQDKMLCEEVEYDRLSPNFGEVFCYGQMQHTPVSIISCDNSVHPYLHIPCNGKFFSDSSNPQ